MSYPDPETWADHLQITNDEWAVLAEVSAHLDRCHDDRTATNEWFGWDDSLSPTRGDAAVAP